MECPPPEAGTMDVLGFQFSTEQESVYNSSRPHGIESPFLFWVQLGCRWDRISERIGQDGRKSPNFVERMDRLDKFFAKNICVLHLLG